MAKQQSRIIGVEFMRRSKLDQYWRPGSTKGLTSDWLQDRFLGILVKFVEMYDSLFKTY